MKNTKFIGATFAAAVAFAFLTVSTASFAGTDANSVPAPSKHSSKCMSHCKKGEHACKKHHSSKCHCKSKKMGVK